MLYEPVTSLTDLVLAILCFSLGVGMMRRFRKTAVWRDGLWAAGFFGMGVSTAIGAVIHGYAGFGAFREAVWFCIWVSAAVGCGCFLLSSLFATFGEEAGSRVMAPVALVLIILFWQAYIVRDMLAVYLAACLIPGAIFYTALAWRLGRRRLLAIPAGALVLGVGAILQALGTEFTLVWHFNQNDVFHLAMMAALPLYYLGANPALLHPVPVPRSFQGSHPESPRAAQAER